MEKLAAKLQRKDLPAVKPGDSVRVQVKIKEGDQRTRAGPLKAL